MTYKEAAQVAIDVQDGVNLTGIAKTLTGPVLDALWNHPDMKGTRWVNEHPIVSMFLFKMQELNRTGHGSLDLGYEKAEQSCRAIIAGE